MSLRTVCVYCGSSKGDKEQYSHAAKRLGEELADRNIRLVYGGGSLGLMETSLLLFNNVVEEYLE